MQGDKERQNSIGFRIKLIHTAMHCGGDAMLERLNLTFSQFRTMIYLAEHDGECISQKDLEGFFSVSHPTMIGILKRLESKGYVQSAVHPRDRRMRAVSLTDTGRDICEKMSGYPQKMERVMLEGISEPKRGELLDMLGIIYENIGRYQAAHTGSEDKE